MVNKNISSSLDLTDGAGSYVLRLTTKEWLMRVDADEIPYVTTAQNFVNKCQLDANSVALKERK